MMQSKRSRGVRRLSGVASGIAVIAGLGALPSAAQTVGPPQAAATATQAPAKSTAPAKTKSQSAKAKATAPAQAAEKLSPADALRQLDAGVAAATAGQLDNAVALISGALASGGLPSTQTARGLYQRGQAYRKLNKPAMAIADLTSALWLKNGLSTADKAEANASRAAAYREAGLSDQTNPVATVDATPKAKQGPAMPVTSSWPALPSLTTATAAAPAQPPAAVAAPAQAEPASGLTKFFAGLPKLFGQAPSTTQPATTASLPAPTQVPASEATAAQPAPPVNWSAKTVSRSPLGASPSSSQLAATAPAAEPLAKATFGLQVAAVRTRAEADQVARQISQAHGPQLQGQRTQIDQAAIGAQGATLFRVRIGPFAEPQEPSALCKTLRAEGHDCLLIKL